MYNVGAVETLVSLTLFSRFVPRSSRLLSLHSIMGNIELALLLINLALQTLEVGRLLIVNFRPLGQRLIC